MSGSDVQGDPQPSQSLPGVSVIIPTHNRKHFLKRALDSILEQSHPTVEIVVVDDGSTDGTEAFVREEYGDRVQYFYQKNLGPSAARNFAFRQCRHPIIAFLDSDDYWHPQRLEILLKHWASLPPEVGLIANDFYQFDDHQRKFVPKRLWQLKTGEITTKQLLIRNRFPPSTAIMRRSLYETCQGFDASLKASEDRDLWIRASHHAKIYFVQDKLTFMRKHEANISKEADRMETSILAMLRKSFRNRVVPRWRLDIWLKAFSFGCFVISCLNNYEQRQRRAWAYLLCSALAWPVHRDTRCALNEPPLFRLRMVLHFIRTNWTSWRPWLRTVDRPTSVQAIDKPPHV